MFLFLILLAVGCGWYLQQVGFADPSKKNGLLARLEEKGLHMQFRELKVHWALGVVAEEVVVGWVGAENETPRLHCEKVYFKLHFLPLSQGDFQPISFQIENGKWLYPIDREAEKRSFFFH